jgi:hypothetical protein
MVRREKEKTNGAGTSAIKEDPGESGRDLGWRTRVLVVMEGISQTPTVGPAGDAPAIIGHLGHQTGRQSPK